MTGEPISLPGEIVVLMPVFNDWGTARGLLELLDAELATAGVRADVLLVNDGSTAPAPAFSFPRRAIGSLRVLDLRRNLGHQRALCVGLAHLHAMGTSVPIVVMDADGQDGPGDVPRLLGEHGRRGGEAAVFAARTKRAEGPLFRILYRVYRLLHRLLVGKDIRVGNFSVLPASFLDALVVSSDLWNHYAATVFRLRSPIALVPVVRAQRIDGRSHMKQTDLVLHGLSAMSVYSDIIGVRMFLACSMLFVLVVAVLVAAAVAGLVDPRVTSGFGQVSGALFVLSLQTLMLCLAFCFILLRGRSGPTFLPLRDCHHFVQRVRDVG